MKVRQTQRINPSYLLASISPSRTLFRLIITAGTKKVVYPTDTQSRQGCSYVSVYFLVVAEISGDERGVGR